MRALFVAVVLCLITPFTAAAQFLVYSPIARPLGVSYEVLKSDHFEIIFEAGFQAEAEAALRVLQKHVDPARELLAHHGSLYMPVVLNGFNDQSNGYVTPLPFKQEVEIPYLKGRSLSPVHTSWMDTVLPHELVHAVHANVQRGFGVGALLRPFAPDIVRAFNLFIPQGISEGLAVHYESRHQEGAGRLNHAFFTMRFRAAMASAKPWSMAQLVEMPAYTRPFDRFYLGGAHLVEYLAAQDSLAFFERSSDLNYRIPFLGYGIGLWYGARQWPPKVYKAFVEEMAAREAERVAKLGTVTMPRVLAAAKGTTYRRPKWIDENTLVVFGSGYNKRSGFYIHNVATGAQHHLLTTLPTSDFVYNLSADRSALLYAHYKVDPLIAIKRTSDLYKVDLASGRQRRFTDGMRLGAPAPGNADEIWALQTAGQVNTLVQVDGQGGVQTLAGDDRVRIQEVAQGPVWVAGVLNVAGTQGLYKLETGGNGVAASPLVHFNDAAIYDVSWSEDGQYLLFTADPGGISNVFVFNIETGDVRQVTNALYGALEPALSPDGQSLAYINYTHEQFELALLPFSFETAVPVNGMLTAPATHTPALFAASSERTMQPEMTASRYRAMRYLKPRSLLPIFRPSAEEAFGRDITAGFGLALQGTDPLERLRYSLDGYYQSGRVWGEGTLQGSIGPLLPYVRAYHTLSKVNTTIRNEVNAIQAIQVGRQRRGVSLGARLPIVLERNVFQSGVTLGLEGAVEETRFFLDNPLPFEKRVFIEPVLTAFYKLQANTRDLIPNQGALLSVQSLLDLHREGGSAARGVITRFTGYMPYLHRANIGLQAHVAWLSQNRGGIYNLDRFLPRGYTDRLALGSGNHLVAGLEYVQPLWYADNGLFMIPFYLKALYAFGFTEGLINTNAVMLGDENETSLPDRRTLFASGVGVGAQFRLFYLFNFDLRFSAAYRHSDRAWDFDLR
ncbi:MAG: hypothetical protein AAF564_10680 [Bacteroidota bacterium]